MQGRTDIKEPEKLQNPTVHLNSQACPSCSAENHKDSAKYCYKCGHFLDDQF